MDTPNFLALLATFALISVSIFGAYKLTPTK